jgi:hypothetical protein
MGVTGLADLSIELVQLKTSDGEWPSKTDVRKTRRIFQGGLGRRRDWYRGRHRRFVIRAVAGGGKAQPLAQAPTGPAPSWALAGKAAILPPEAKISRGLRNAITLTEAPAGSSQL